MDIRSRALLPVCLLVVALAFAGCGGTASPSPAPSTTPSAGPTAIPVPTEALPDWTCDGAPIHLAGTAARAQQQAMSVGQTQGVVSFQFASRSGGRTVPEVEIIRSSPPFSADPSGLPVEVDGLDWATIVLRGGTGVDENGNQTYAGPDRWSGLEVPLVEVVRLGDFEAVSTWAVGLSGAYCVRAYPQATGSELIVEFRLAPSSEFHKVNGS